MERFTSRRSLPDAKRTQELVFPFWSVSHQRAEKRRNRTAELGISLFVFLNIQRNRSGGESFQCQGLFFFLLLKIDDVKVRPAGRTEAAVKPKTSSSVWPLISLLLQRQPLVLAKKCYKNWFLVIMLWGKMFSLKDFLKCPTVVVFFFYMERSFCPSNTEELDLFTLTAPAGSEGELVKETRGHFY